MIITECPNFFSIKKIKVNYFQHIDEHNFVIFLFPKCDLAPKIVQQAKFVRHFENEGDDVSITGCRIISYFNLTNSDIYWLKDGIQKVMSEVASFNKQYSMENLQFAPSSYQNQGFYQCVVFSKGYMKRPIISEKIHVQFAGKKLYTILALFVTEFGTVTFFIPPDGCIFCSVKLWRSSSCVSLWGLPVSVTCHILFFLFNLFQDWLKACIYQLLYCSKFNCGNLLLRFYEDLVLISVPHFCQFS